MEKNKSAISFFEFQDFIIFMIGAFFVIGLMLLGGLLLGEKSNSNNRNIPFESGLNSYGSSKIRFAIQFYLVSVLFVIFDVESVFFYSWAVSIKECGWEGLIKSFCFSVTLFAGLFYSIKSKVLNWIQKEK